MILAMPSALKAALLLMAVANAALFIYTLKRNELKWVAATAIGLLAALLALWIKP